MLLGLAAELVSPGQIRNHTMLLELIKCGKSYSSILAVEHLVHITALPGRRRLPA